VERRLFEMDIIKNTKTNEMRGCDKIYAVLAAHKHEYDEDLPDIYVLEFGRFPINEDFYNFEYSGSKQDINALSDQGYASTVISKIQKEIDDAINRKNESNTRADAEIDILKHKLEDFKKLNCSGGGISWEDEK
jgi:hypothetical protein